MQFEITNDNSPYLDSRGKIVLNACPGSGKTTSVAYKLKILMDECKTEHGDYAGIACLSFTNVAKDEIFQAFAKINGSHIRYPHLVSTIDSFINHYITLPYYYLLEKNIKRPQILDKVSFLDDMNLGNHKNNQQKPLKYSYPPSQLKIEIDNTYTWNGHKPNPKIVSETIFKKYAKEYKRWQFDNGYLNNDDSTFLAAFLLEKYPSIAKSLIERFPYFIIDEAQDTSEIQYKIFDLLISAGLKNIEFVGDPYQSLYEFREARPDLFIARFNNKSVWQQFRLNHCRRSSQQIINVYSLFRETESEPIRSICNHTTDHKIHVIRFSEDDPISLITKYETLIDNNYLNQILVRGGTHLEVFGAKATSEEPWKNNIAITILRAQNYFLQGNSKISIDILRMCLAQILLPTGNYREQRAKEKEIKNDSDINILLFDFIKKMPDQNDTLKNWTMLMTEHIKNTFGIETDLQLKQKGKQFYNKNLLDFLYPQAKIPHPISTIHKAKGMTFDSVLLVLSKNSSGEQISLTDFKNIGVLPTEKQRMLYVALSRPKYLACIGVPDSWNKQQIKEILGDDIIFV
ncbi:ATP-dependent helicase [Chryseobacterium sp. BIGb0232]|uniref:ATP-dependent helicase n=1 Tax=Chryseobacterium sp. BIGb0232 TaxID=2940598 RepID=UPI000F471CD4|nr:ATP-dependent helicase [Chryseobacterium sp. BIGb0232]MCS4302418.1 superfamily I DNA/RNA helicase [Chryseobacterium sp. BIGb0232]ROS18361.1 superfamily I DNA/RNA helicase [Chryseobacterium nakagawai]